MPINVFTSTDAAVLSPSSLDTFIVANDDLLALLGLPNPAAAVDQAILDLLHPLAERALKDHPLVQSELVFQQHTEYLPIGRDTLLRTGLADYDMTAGYLMFSGRFSRMDRLPLKHTPVWNDGGILVWEAIGAYAEEAANQVLPAGVTASIGANGLVTCSGKHDLDGTQTLNVYWIGQGGGGGNVAGNQFRMGCTIAASPAMTPTTFTLQGGNGPFPLPTSATPITLYWDSFNSQTLLIPGQDYYLNVDGQNADGSQSSSTGHLIRAYAVWPNEPRSIKVVYNGGWRPQDFAGGRAAGIRMAAIITTTAAFWAWKAKIDNDGRGPEISESIGKHSGSFNGEELAAGMGLSVSVPPQALAYMQDKLNCFARYSA